MQWTPDMLRALGVGETGVQQVFSQTAPVPRSGPFPNYTLYTQAGRTVGIPPSGRALIPTGARQTITDATFKELPKQRALPVGAIRPQIGYTPAREAITSQEALGNIRRFSKPYAQQVMEDVVQTAPKAAKGLSKVAKAGIGGAGGALVMDMLFPDTANDIDDVAMIQQYKPLRSHGMTTPQTGGFPALQQMPNQAQFEKEFRKSQEMKKSDYGKVPGTGYIQFDETGAYGGKQRKAGERLVFDNSTPLGGFSRSSTADDDIARQAQWAREAEEQRRQELIEREYRDELAEQQSFDSGARWALDNPRAPGAAAYLMQLQMGRKIGQPITPLSERQAGWYKTKTEGEAKQAQGQAQLRQALGSPEEQALKQAQAQYYTAQAAGLPQANAIKAAQALQTARAKLAENDARTLDAVLKAGDPNAIMALGAYPQFRNFVAAYLAAQEASKE